jgi:hypothetical protein
MQHAEPLALNKRLRGSIMASDNGDAALVMLKCLLISAAIACASGCQTLTPTVGQPVAQVTYDSFVLGGTSQQDVRRAIGYDAPRSRYTTAGQVDFYGIGQYTGKNYIPGYAFVGDRMSCDVWWFEYDANHVLVQKGVSHDCKDLMGVNFRGLSADRGEGAAERMSHETNAAPRPQPVAQVAPRGVAGREVVVNRDLRAWFGPGGEGGLLVTTVEKDGPAARAGIRVGDVITEVDGQPTAPYLWSNAALLITNGEGNTATLTVARK